VTGAGDQCLGEHLPLAYRKILLHYSLLGSLGRVPPRGWGCFTYLWWPRVPSCLLGTLDTKGQVGRRFPGEGKPFLSVLCSRAGRLHSWRWALARSTDSMCLL
jgi:hypothetical protein